MRKIHWLKMLAFGLLAFGVLSVLGVLYDPAIASTIGFSEYKYRAERTNSIDVIMAGSSFMYCSYTPIEAYERHGFTSYVVASPEQPIEATYHRLASVLDTQTPKAVMLEVKSLAFAPEEAKPLERALEGYGVHPFFNFFRFHGRWDSLGEANYKGAFKHLFSIGDRDVYKGYVHLTEHVAVAPTHRDIFDINSHYEKNLPHLDRLLQLCEKKGIDVIFYVAPAGNVNHFDAYAADLAARYPQIPLINMAEHWEEAEIDFALDYFDSGHLNYTGAAKCTAFLSDYLQEAYGFADRRGNTDWEADALRYGGIVGE